MDRKKLIFLLIFLIIIVGAIITLLLVNYFGESKQQRSCYIQEPFNCKEVKIFTQEQLDSQNYVLLEATGIQELRIISESVNVGICTNAYLDQELLISSDNKDIKIILECPNGVENETINGGLEMLYLTLNGDVKKSKLIFNVKRVEPIVKRVVDTIISGITNTTKKRTGGGGGRGGGGSNDGGTAAVVLGSNPESPLIIAESQSYDIGTLSDTLYFILGGASVLSFNINGEPHKITLIDQEDRTIIILNVQSVQSTVIVTVDDVNVVDLNGDGILDVAIETSTNSVGDRYITLKKISDPDIQKRPPIINIISPTEGQIFTTESIVVSGTARDAVKLAYVNVKLNGVVLTNISLKGKIATWQIPITLIPGDNIIEAQSFNAFGVGSNIAKVNVKYEKVIPQPLEKIAPIVSAISSPINPSAIDSITITTSANDQTTGNSGIKEIRVYVDGNLSKTCAFTSVCVLSKCICVTDAKTYSIGSYTYYAIAIDGVDNNANTGNKTFSVTKADIQNPAVAITYPIIGSKFTNATVIVKGTASDDMGVTSVRVRLNNAALWSTATGTNSWNIPVTLTLGNNTIEAQSWDVSGKNSTIAVIKVTLEIGGDETNPTISVSHSPANPTTIDGITITANANDINTGDSGIKEIRVYVDGTLSRTCPFASVCILNSCTCTTTATNYSLGTHTYYAEATDGADNINRDPVSGTKSFLVLIAPDTIAPFVTITTPTAGQIFTITPITVSGTASDNVAVSSVRIRVNAGSWITATGTTSWTASVSLNSGSNTIEAQSVDTASLTSIIATRSVTYNAPPICSDDCSQFGIIQCSGTGYRTCGNYDNDTCLEWSSVFSCPTNYTCSGGVCINPIGPKNVNHQYPRTGILIWGGGTDDWFSRFDLVITPLLRPQSEAVLYKEIIRRAKAISPNSYYMTTTDWNAGGVFNPPGVTSTLVPDTWIIRRQTGEFVYIYNSAILRLSDITPLCGKYTGTVYEWQINNETYSEALPRIHNSAIDWDIYDGFTSDGTWPYPNSGTAGIDLDRNGLNDLTEAGKGRTWVLNTWKEGYNKTFQSLRNIWGNNQKLITYWTVGVHGDGWYGDTPLGYNLVNGVGWERMFYNAPGDFAQWQATISKWEQNSQSPQINYLVTAIDYFYSHACVAQPDAPSQTRAKDFYRLMRWGLGWATLNNVYFMVEDNEHFQMLYYDEFDLELGYPTSNALKLSNGVYVRFFDNGISIVNPAYDAGKTLGESGLTRTVTDLMLRQEYPAYYKGPYYRFVGNQDPNWNNGAAFDNVTLRAYRLYADSTQYTSDGIILVNQPNKVVVSDIIVDNAYSGTSPGSIEATLVGFTRDAGAAIYPGGMYTNPTWNTGPRTDDSTGSNGRWYRSTIANANSGASATFNPTINVPGQYEIFEWHGYAGADSNSISEATNAPVTINHMNGVTNKNINQRTNAGKWNSLGIFNYTKAGDHSLIIRTNGADGTVIADAFMWEYIGPIGAQLQCTSPNCTSDLTQYCSGGQWITCGTGTRCSTSSGQCVAVQTCTPGIVQSGTTCLVCNVAGTAYIQNDSKCTGGNTCNINGQCVDTINPVVSVAHSPTETITTIDTVTLTAIASDTSGIKQIQIYVDDGVAVATCTSSPCTYSHPFTSGIHNYYATALDNYDNMGVDPLVGTRTFSVAGNDITAPTISVSHSPTNPNSLQQVTIKTSATDVGRGDSGITEIRVYVDGALIQTCTFASACTLASCVCDSTSKIYSNGTHTYYATAIDGSANSNLATDPAIGTKNFVVTDNVPSEGQWPDYTLRGINVIGWDNGARTLNAADMQKLKDWNINLIRIHIVHVRASEYSAMLDELERIVNLAEQYDIKAIVEFMALEGGYNYYGNAGSAFWTDFAVQEYTIDFWELIATRLKDRNIVVGFDILNEPSPTSNEIAGLINVQPGSAGDIGYFYSRATAAIRAIDSDRTVILEFPCGGQLLCRQNNEWTFYMPKMNETNLVYSYHHYQPNIYTHQGGGCQVADIRYYPGYDHLGEYFDSARTRYYVKKVSDWATANNAKIYVGEYSLCADAPNASLWLTDVTNAFDEFGFSTTYHAYKEFVYWDLEYNCTACNPSIPGMNCELCDSNRINVIKNYWTHNTAIPTTYSLTVSKLGTGTGTVTSSPTGINCGVDCSESYASGTSVILIATPGSGNTFSGWSGACIGTGTCTVSMTAARTVTATFTGTAGDTDLIIDHNDVAKFESIPDSAITLARNYKSYFQHASVGGNIGGGTPGQSYLIGDNGLNDIQATNNVKYNRTNFFFYNYANPPIAVKMSNFVSYVAANSARHDAFGMKFCFIDTTVSFADYRTTMENLETTYPTKKFIWWTQPVTIGGEASILAFNTQVRDYAKANNKILFDVAAIESHRADGTACLASGREAMCSEWTYDGGHLDADGRLRPAKAYWYLMARLAGWDGISIPSACTPDANVCLNRQCGSWANGTCGTVSCGSCSSGYTCNATGRCVTTQLCTPGTVQSGTTCLVCNSAGTAYVQTDSRCNAGYTCNTLGQCITSTSKIYYVDSILGNDANDGKTTSTPWKTISKVNAQTFTPGDSILFAKGRVWTEILIPRNSGNSTSPIIFGAYGTGPKPVITRIQELANWRNSNSWTNTGNNIWTMNVAFPNRLWLNGQETGVSGQPTYTYGTGTSTPTSTYRWYHDGTTLKLYSETNPATNYNSINVSATSSSDIPLTINSKNYLTFNNIEFRGGYDNIYVRSSNYTIFDNCTAGWGAGSSVFRIVYSNNGIIHHSILDRADTVVHSFSNCGTLSGCASEGVWLGSSSYWDVHNNLIANPAHTGVNILAQGNGERSVYNKIHNNMFRMDGGDYAHAYSVQGTSNTLGEAAYNEFYQNYEYGFTSFDEIQGDHNKVYYNIINGMRETPWYQYSGYYGAAVSMTTYCLSQYNEVFNNLYMNAPGVGFYIQESNPTVTSHNSFVNNILINNGWSNKIPYDSVLTNSQIWVDNNAGPTYNTIKNNIVYSSSRSDGAVISYHGVGTANRMTVAQFEAAAAGSDYASGNIFADPKLNGISGLQSTSPAIDKGLTISPPITRDYYGNSVPYNGIVDIGSFEYR